jgi:hypothetical protein
MWVKGTPLHFIVDTRSQNNLISPKVVEQLDFLTTPQAKKDNFYDKERNSPRFRFNKIFPISHRNLMQ